MLIEVNYFSPSPTLKRRKSNMFSAFKVSHVSQSDSILYMHMQHGTCWTFISLSAARWEMRETPCTRRGENEWQTVSLRIRLLAMSQWYRADWKCATAVGSKRSSAHSTAKESAISASDFSHKHPRASFSPALSSRHRTWAFETANCYFRYNIYI